MNKTIWIIVAFGATLAVSAAAVPFGASWRLPPEQCEHYLSDAPTFSDETQARAAEIVSWISMTHPMIYRAAEMHGDNNSFFYDLPHFTTGYSLPPHIAGRAADHFDLKTKFKSGRLFGRPGKDRLSAVAELASGDTETASGEARREFVERLLLRTAQIMAIIGQNTGRRPIISKVANLWDPGKIQQTFAIYWYDSFSGDQCAAVRRLLSYFEDPKVIHAVVRALYAHVPLIVSAQRALVTIVDSRPLEDWRMQIIAEKFAQTPEYLAIKHLTLELPNGKIDQAQAVSRLASDKKACAVLNVAAILAFAERDLPTTQVERWTQLLAAIDLLRECTTELLEARSTDVNWRYWRTTANPAREWLIRLAWTIADARTSAVGEMARLNRARPALQALDGWLDRLTVEIARATPEAPDSCAMGAQEMIVATSLLRRSTELKTLLGDTFEGLSRRQQVLTRQLDANAQVSVMITALEVARLNGVEPLDLQPLRDAVVALASDPAEVRRAQ